MIFVLSNRVAVQIGFWPFGTVSAWLGPVAVGALAIGFFLGLVAALPRQLHWRRRARSAEKRVTDLSAQAQPPAVK
ncbi:LapA family protein [Acidocella sp.]|uniref:LapA family protein n=1 Tax=Acidocella sp. TaxID=50710 RepID=UPI003D004952